MQRGVVSCEAEILVVFACLSQLAKGLIRVFMM